MLKDTFKLFVLSALTMLMMSCQVMQSDLESVDQDYGIVGCSSELGSYSLAYSTLPIEIKQIFNKKTNAQVGGSTLLITDPNRRPDRKHRFCLNYVDKGLSDDNITIKLGGTGKAKDATLTNDAGNGLLALAVSKSIDRSGEIIQDLLQSLFIVLSGDPAFSVNRETLGADEEARTVFSDEIQPFEVGQMAAFNRRIARFGFCLTLGEYTFSASQLSVDEYCNNPDLSLIDANKSAHVEAYESQHYIIPPGKLPQALYYRPRRNYDLHVYVREDPDANDPWELWEIRPVSMENMSPILGLGINRALFAENRVVMAFDQGDLLDVCIARGSTAKAAIEIPLDIVYGIVGLPAAIVRANIKILAKEDQVLQAQTQVLAAQEALIKAQASDKGQQKKVESKTLDPNATRPTARQNKAVSVLGGEVTSPDGFCDNIKTVLGVP